MAVLGCAVSDEVELARGSCRQGCGQPPSDRATARMRLLELRPGFRSSRDRHRARAVRSETQSVTVYRSSLNSSLAQRASGYFVREKRRPILAAQGIPGPKVVQKSYKGLLGAKRVTSNGRFCTPFHPSKISRCPSCSGRKPLPFVQ